MMENDPEEGFSSLFYLMLLLGIVGLVGFLFIAGGAASGAL